MKALAWLLLVVSALIILGVTVMAFEYGSLLTTEAIGLAYIIGALVLSIDKIRQPKRETK